jgi:hypothetical protein
MRPNAGSRSQAAVRGDDDRSQAVIARFAEAATGHPPVGEAIFSRW